MPTKVTLSTGLELEVKDFKPAGYFHAAGVVPDPGSTPGTSRFLREDGTWTSPAPAVTIAFDEAPTGTINGVNDTFTLANTPSGGVFLFVSSIGKCWAGVTYNLSGATIVFTAGNIPQTGDLISATYSY